MSKAGYSATTQADVALAAATAKSVIGVTAPATFGIDLTKFRIGFAGITAGAVPGLIELCAATFATNAPGTNSTSATVQQDYGRAITAGFTAAYNWTTEPTVLTVIDSWLLTPTGGLVIYDYPLGTSPDNAVSTGFVLRCTFAAIVNLRATLHFERC